MQVSEKTGVIVRKHPLQVLQPTGSDHQGWADEISSLCGVSQLQQIMSEQGSRSAGVEREGSGICRNGEGSGICRNGLSIWNKLSFGFPGCYLAILALT